MEAGGLVVVAEGAAAVVAGEHRVVRAALAHLVAAVHARRARGAVAVLGLAALADEARDAPVADALRAAVAVVDLRAAEAVLGGAAAARGAHRIEGDAVAALPPGARGGRGRGGHVAAC